MADPNDPNQMAMENQWRSPQYRQKVVAQIDDAMKQSGNPITKSSLEMEQHVFMKARTREEYLALVARLIIHVREIKNKGQGGQQVAGLGTSPIDGLMRLTNTGPGATPQQMAPGQMQPGQMQMQPGQMQPGQMQMQPGQMQPGQMQPGQMQPGQMQPGQMQPGQMQPGQMQPGMPPGHMIGQSRQPFDTYRPPMHHPGMQQSMQRGSMGPIRQGFPQGMQPQPGMPQQAMLQQPGMQQQPGMLQQPGMPQQQPGMPQQQPGMPQQQPGMSQQPGMPQQQPGMPQQQPGMPQQQPGMSQQPGIDQQIGIQQTPFSMGMTQPQSMPGQFTSMHDNHPSSIHGPGAAVTVSTSSIGQPRPQQIMVSQSQPSIISSQPTQQVSQNQVMSTSSMVGAPSPIGLMAHSPAPILAVPSPSSVPPSMSIAQSPASRGFTGAPSPGGAIGGPSSIGPVPSPHSQTTEEQAYLAKWKQLQIYIEPLKRMINRMAKDEDRTNMRKMKNLLDILSDSSKRVSMNALLKCEQVLRQMDTKPSTDPLPTKAADTHMCQTLLDAVVSQIKSPMLNHTLYRTFGPAVQALHGPPIQVPQPAAKRQKTDEDSRDGVQIPSLLQGEVARLSDRFRVVLHPQHHAGSKSIQLLCKLQDRRLPTVPPVAVTIPEDYPHTSPICDGEMDEYTTTPYLQKVHKLLSNQLQQLPDRYALTALLNTWEMSVRTACSPAV